MHSYRFSLRNSFSFHAILLVATIVTANLASWKLTAQTASVAADSERAIVRSQEDLIQARSLMQSAMQKYSQHDLQGAYAQAAQAMTMVPSGTSANPTRNALLSDYTTIALAFSRELADNGVFTDSIAKKSGVMNANGLPLSAESVAKSILDPSMNPGSKAAVKFLSDLEQPGIFNKTVTPAFAAKREEVIKLLRQASDLTKTGRDELALKQYEAILQIDPYNNAARKGMEEIHNSTIKYADESYNETRSRMLWQVEKSWERPPRKSKQGRTTESVGRQQDIRGTDQITAKLNSIIIPKIDLSDSPISEAVEYLKQKSVEQDPNHKGVNIFLKLGSQPSSLPTQAEISTNAAASAVPAQPNAGSTEPHITLALSHVPLYVALDYISKLCNLKLKVDPYAISIVPLSEPTDILITKEYQVPPTFIPPKPLDSGSALPQAGTAPSAANMPRVAARYNAQDYLLSQGVEFPTGSSANYLPSGSKLVVRNTRDNIDQIDALVDAAMGVAPSQVDIQTKFIEINQNNIQELGFDWLLGPFSIGGSGVYGSGGGGSNSLNSANYPFNSAGMNTVGSLRSGDRAISQNSIGALLAGQAGGSIAPAPGVFSVAGVFTDPQFQMVIHALNQKKGVDLMAAPKVTTKSGVKATVKIVNEFIYPRQYDPPTFSQAGGGGQGGTTTQNPLTIPPPTVTPSFPRDFTKQDLGVVLEAKPTIGPDGYTIDLELNPKVTDFDGFINYGSPINGVGYQLGTFLQVPALIPISQTLTTNTINQPVFSVREVNTFVTVWDGQTVALGGLIREDVQKIQDKVPILGDIPMAGRLFRSDADQKIKKNLVIFVTPRILDAEGQPRRGDTEESEIVTPLGLPQEMPQPSMTSSAVRGK
ncbi:MAG: type II and III secretion system protein [Verrucomicrobia bacterium]|nr:type II and III secretion system protein [Verrucomicrobiota bacterium]